MAHTRRETNRPLLLPASARHPGCDAWLSAAHLGYTTLLARPWGCIPTHTDLDYAIRRAPGSMRGCGDVELNFFCGCSLSVVPLRHASASSHAAHHCAYVTISTPKICQSTVIPTDFRLSGKRQNEVESYLRIEFIASRHIAVYYQARWSSNQLFG